MSDTRTYAEKRKAIRMRANLIELLNGVLTTEDVTSSEEVADHLIANCVTVTIKKEKPPTDLSGKCGSCAYAKAEPDKFGRDYYVRCTNPEHIAKYFSKKDRSIRQRTNPACKQYKPKELE